MAIYLLRVNLDIEEEKPEKSWRFLKAAETIKKFSKENKVVILSHYGRPRKFNRRFSLIKFKRPLEKVLRRKVVFIPTSRIKKAANIIKERREEKVFLIDNLRFIKGEATNSRSLSQLLASLGHKYINDDFATSHRINASNVGITNFLPSYAGPTILDEVKNLKRAFRPRKPFVLIIGGVKVADKIGVIKNLIKKADFVLFGGGVANTFMKAQGIDIGGSIFEHTMLTEAKNLSRNKKIIIPEDYVQSDSKIVDIGPETIKKYSLVTKGAKTIVWGGPMGLFEKKIGEKGTKAIWEALLKNRQAALVVVGGGETTASLKLVKRNYRLPPNIFLSTGGGAMLDFLAGKDMPALEALKLQKK